MKVLVTGAAGRMGSETCRVLAADGWNVIATDLRPRDDLPMPIRIVDLLDRHAVEALAAEGVDAVVHLGNHIVFRPPDTQMIFTQNVTMNVNVFQSAVEHGARKMVFASSIQVLASVPRLPDGSPFDMPAYLPLDHESPAKPTNPYALSKLAGEAMVDYYARVHGVQGVSLRLPWMVNATHLAKLQEDTRSGSQPPSPQILAQALAYLTFADAAALVAAILRSDLPGSRIYLPASAHNMLQRPAREVIEKFYPTTPLRKPLDGEGLVDISRIQRETRWTPRD